MNIIICNNYEELSKKAADIVAEQIKLKPNSVLGLATGSTPLGLYERLAAMNKSGEISFRNVSSFNLDEYYPISADNDQSYRYFMNKNLFSKIDIKPENTFIPDGEAKNPSRECSAYDRKILEYGGIDLQILGIGQNGHIGFNEPGASLNSDTHLTPLTESTIKANSRFFERTEDVPTHALTMGIASILKSKKIVLLASGKSKRRVVSALLEGGINTSVPATMLKVHSNVTLICDKDAYPGMYLGIDIGGTDTKFAVIDPENTPVYSDKIRTPIEDGDRGIIHSIAEKCREIAEKYPICKIGMGTPGEIDKKRGTVRAVNLPFNHSPIADYLREEIDLPVSLENDACCAAIGESYEGIGAKNIFMVTLGTGIGGGIVIDGKIYSGAGGKAGEIGHICIDPNGRDCACGHKGCWEAYASVNALIGLTLRAAEKNPDSILNRIILKDGKADGKTVFAAMDEGCPVAQKVFDEYIGYLSVGIRNIIVTFDPDTVVIGGSISREGERLLAPLREKVASSVPIAASVLQDKAGAIGAALIPKLQG